MVAFFIIDIINTAIPLHMLNIGCHLSLSKGYEAMGVDALSINANTFQFFTRNPRGGKAKAIDENDVTISLSAKEFKLLSLFLRNPRRVLSRDAILERMSAGFDNYDRTIDVQISRLRAKLRDSGRNATLIRTMRGDGYMLAVAVEKPKPLGERL